MFVPLEERELSYTAGATPAPLPSALTTHHSPPYGQQPAAAAAAGVFRE